MPSYIGFTPTPREEIDGFFELAPVSSSDVVYDLGSGDGRLLFTALEKGVGRAVGVEIDPESIHQARQIGLEAGLRYVYSGNLPGDEGENTICFSCGQPLIERWGYHISKNVITDGKCPKCNTSIDGIGFR